MNLLRIASSLLFAGCALAQTPVPPASAPTQAELRQALVGDWTGVLEYRDYSEPPASQKRVELPTWLSVSAAGAADTTQTWHYIYDDGPAKVIDEIDAVAFDPKASTYSEAANGKPASVYSVAGFDKLRGGRGQLVLTRKGEDSGKPAEMRVTLTIRRNLLEVLEEVRAAGSTEPFAFRHVFRFTRAQPPALTKAP